MLVLAFSPAVRAEIPWIQSDIDTAFNEARARKKPVLIDFYTTWCSWCLELDDKVFSDPDVIEECKGFVPLRVNCDRPVCQRLVKRYKVSTFPTILVTTPGGEVLGRLGMFRPADEFVRFLKESRTPGQTLDKIDRRIEDGERTAELYLRSAERHFEAGDFEKATERYEQALAASAGSGPAAAVDARMGLARARSMTGDTDGAIAQYREILARYPSSARLQEAFVATLVLLREVERGSEIDALFREYAGRFPDDPAILNDHARRILETGGDAAVALQNARRATEISPDSADYHATLARALLASGRPADALEAAGRAVDLRPADKALRLLRLEALEAARAAVKPPATPPAPTSNP